GAVGANEVHVIILAADESDGAVGKHGPVVDCLQWVDLGGHGHAALVLLHVYLILGDLEERGGVEFTGRQIYAHERRGVGLLEHAGERRGAGGVVSRSRSRRRLGDGWPRDDASESAAIDEAPFSIEARVAEQ